MIAGVPRETYPGERRVAIIPATVPALAKAGFTVMIQAGAGADAGYPDSAYVEKGAELAPSREDVFAKSDVVLQVRLLGANMEAGKADLGMMRSGQVFIGFADPLSEPKAFRSLAEKRVTVFAMELIPRIARAQGMDALSSMSTVAGYKAVLIAAHGLGRMFPMLMTAAGTISPARVFVIGAGIAGLEAIATAHRLGAVVRGYDVRPAVKEQVESLGARFIELGIESGDAEGTGGYAREMSEAFYTRQRDMMARAVAESDVVITTAAVPGKKSPVLITEDMVKGMAPGSIIVDIAAERGGNCEVTKPGETVLVHGVTIAGPLNLPAAVPYHASQMYAKNISMFLLALTKDGSLAIDRDDEIVRETLVVLDGEITNDRVRELLGPASGGSS
jgi:NAD(P) transhydrogenase subunit alpha